MSKSKASIYACKQSQSFIFNPTKSGDYFEQRALFSLKSDIKNHCNSRHLNSPQIDPKKGYPFFKKGYPFFKKGYPFYSKGLSLLLKRVIPFLKKVIPFYPKRLFLFIQKKQGIKYKGERAKERKQNSEQINKRTRK
jgi:hypothetical protein